MANIKQQLNGNILTLTIDLNAPGERSKSGKSIVIATTSGNISVAGKPEFKLGLNLYKPA
jgi:hypothetical protein